MARLRNILALLRGQFWIIPAMATVLAAVLAYVILRYGYFVFQTDAGDIWWLYSGDASTARDLLSSLLSGMMTMTSLVVSVTFVVLALAANQLGPRLIAIFMADRQIQLVLGLFFATIFYVIAVLRTLDDTLGSEGVPHLAVSVAVVLTLACLFALLFYIHKLGRSIIADNVIESVSRGLQSDLRELLPSEAPPEADAPQLEGTPSHAIALQRRGYIQVIDYDKLVRVAREEDVLLKVTVAAGDFVLREGDHVVVYADHVVDDSCHAAIRQAFTIGNGRTPAQDPEHGLKQLVEIALRALSPGINDSFTAGAVIDRLGSAFEEIFAHPARRTVFTDEDSKVRVIAARSDSAAILEATLDPIRQAGEGQPMILVKIAAVLAQLAPSAENGADKAVLLAQLRKLAETVRGASLAPADRQSTLSRIDEALAAVAASGAPKGAALSKPRGPSLVATSSDAVRQGRAPDPES